MCRETLRLKVRARSEERGHAAQAGRQGGTQAGRGGQPGARLIVLVVNRPQLVAQHLQLALQVDEVGKRLACQPGRRAAAAAARLWLGPPLLLPLPIRRLGRWPAAGRPRCRLRGISSRHDQPAPAHRSRQAEAGFAAGGPSLQAAPQPSESGPAEQATHRRRAIVREEASLHPETAGQRQPAGTPSRARRCRAGGAAGRGRRLLRAPNTRSTLGPHIEPPPP